MRNAVFHRFLQLGKAFAIFVLYKERIIAKTAAASFLHEDLALARSERSPKRFYSMSAQIRLERKEYYDILEQTQKGAMDVTAWMQWFLGCLDRAFDGAEGTLSDVLRKAKFWESHSGESFNERQQKVINRLLDGFEGKLTSSKWAKLTKCSQDTASRDINDLVKRSILTKDSAGGRSTSYSLSG